MVIQMRWFTGAANTQDKLYAGANQLLNEAFSSIRVIHAYNLQDYVQRTYGVVLATANTMGGQQAHIGGLSMGFAFFVLFAMYAMIIYFGGWEVSCASRALARGC